MNQRHNHPAPALRLYTFLLRLYPDSYRRAFGSQMLQTFRDRYNDLSAQKKGVGILFWVDVVSDAIFSISREHVAGWQENTHSMNKYLLAFSTLLGGLLTPLHILIPPNSLTPLLNVTILFGLPALAGYAASHENNSLLRGALGGLLVGAVSAGFAFLTFTVLSLQSILDVRMLYTTPMFYVVAGALFGILGAGLSTLQYTLRAYPVARIGSAFKTSLAPDNLLRHLLGIRVIAAALIAAAIVVGLAFFVVHIVNEPVVSCAPVQDSNTHPPASLVTAQDYFRQGNYLYDQGNCDAAIAAYSRALELNPNYAEAYNNRAYTYMVEKKYANALPDLDKAISIRPTYVNALMNRGDIYNSYYNMDQTRAIADYDRVLMSDPTASQHTSVCGHRIVALNHGMSLGLWLSIVSGVYPKRQACSGPTALE